MLLKTATRLLFMLALVGCGENEGDNNPSADASFDASIDMAMDQPDLVQDITTDTGQGRDADEPVPSFAELQEMIFTPRCGERNCHGDTGSTGSPDLQPMVAYDNIVANPSRRLPSMNYIEPGAPESSFIFRKLMGTEGEACEELGQAASGCGGPMPPSFAQQPGPLPDEDIQALRRWIEAGAPRD